MKKNIINTGFKAFICVTLLGAAVALPMAARRDINGFANTALEADTPSEYAQEFPDETVEGGGNLLEEIYLTDSQLAPLAAMAKAAYKEYFDLEIPQDMTMGAFAYMDDDEYGLCVSLDWAFMGEHYDPDAEDVRYSAQFVWMDIEKGTATLSWINCRNGFDVKLMENYEKMAREAYESQLDITIPGNYTLDERILFKAFLPSYARTVVEFYWRDQKAEANRINIEQEDESYRITDEYGDSYLKLTSYQAAFEDINLEAGTGKLTGLFKNSHYANIYNVYDKEIKITQTPVFTDAQKDFMLEAAKSFARKQNIELGELRLESSCNLGGVHAMHYIFHAEGLNGTTDTDASFYVSDDGNIVGYFY